MHNRNSRWFDIGEMAQLGAVFAERLNRGDGPDQRDGPDARAVDPIGADGVFWNPDADANFLTEARQRLRPDIPVHTRDCHINAPEFARAVVDEFLALITNEDTRS